MERERTDAEYQSLCQEKQREINNQLNMGNVAGALKAAVADPPLGCKDQGIKDNYSRAVVSVLTAVKEADINKNVDALNPDELDVLMKYIYKGLEDGENSNSLLKWHAAATAKGGLGSIVRTLAERRTV